MKKVLRYLIVIVVLGGVLFLTSRTWKSYQTKKEIERRVQTLQHCSFQTTTGKEIYLDEFDPSQPTIIIYFHPECEHCQYEAREIGFHADELSRTNLVMITPDDSIQRIEKFARVNHLWELNNFELLKDSKYAFKKYFGTAKVPSIFIYKNHHLLKRYSGETKIEAILSIINN